jgi:hypothetical protein
VERSDTHQSPLMAAMGIVSFHHRTLADDVALGARAGNNDEGWSSQCVPNPYVGFDVNRAIPFK